MKIVRNSLIPVPGFTAMNLCGVLFVRGQAAIDDEMLRHERIHTRQMREMGYLPFYIWYVAAWLVRLLWALVSLPLVDKKRRRHCLYGAYANLWLEREAYRHAPDAHYLEHRRHYAWLIEPLSACRSGCKRPSESEKGQGARSRR